MKVNKALSISNRYILLIGFLMIGLPIYATNGFIDYVKLFGTDVTIFHLSLLFVIAFSFIKKSMQKKIQIFKIHILIFILIVIILAQLFNGVIRNYNITYILRDLNFYIQPILVFLVFFDFFKKNKFTLEDLLKYFFYAILLLCSLNTLMYFTQQWSFWRVESFAGDRFGGSYLSSIIFIFWYGIYIIFNNRKQPNKIIIIYFIIVSILSINLSKSRALLVLTMISSIIVGYKNVVINKKYINIKKFLKFFIFLLLIVIFIIIIINSKSGMIDRFINTDLSSKDDSALVRVNLYINNIIIFCKNPLGLGIGATLPHYNGYGNIIGYGNFIDNAYITIAEKLGVIAVVIYLYMTIFKPIYFLYKQFRISKNDIYICCCVSYILFLINTGFLTCQIVNSTSVSTMVWIFNAFVFSYRHNSIDGRYEND